jgi:hypothetical protein
MTIVESLPTTAILLIAPIRDCLRQAEEATTLEDARSHIRESVKYVNVLLAAASKAADEVGSKPSVL